MAHRTRSRVVVAVALSLAWLAPARAASLDAPGVPAAPTPPPAAPAPPASDLALNIGQLGLAAGTMVGSYFLAGAIWDGAPKASVGLVLLAPFIAGQSVCALGQQSVRHHGGCGLALAGAYLGAAAIIPTVLLACTFNLRAETAGSDSVCAASIMLTWFVVAPVGAVIGWNEGKQLRAGAAPDPPEPPPVDPPVGLYLSRRWEGGAPDARRLTFPVLAFRF